MQRYLALYGEMVKQQLKTLLEYRASFIIGGGATVLQQAASLLTIWVVMRQVPSMAGWTLPQMALVYGFMSLSRSLNQMFTDNTWHLGSYIRQGGFDHFLVRPIDPLFHLLADNFNVDGIGNFLVGVVLIVGAGGALGVFNSPGSVLYAVVAVISGAVIFTAITLITCVSAFWLTDATALSAVVFENHRFAYYPLTIYPRAFGFALTWIIPYGFASFYPVSFLLGHDIGPLAWLGPVIALALLAASYQIWLIGLRHYTSTGS